MMKWKRIVSAAVCVCMAGMLITGCGSKSDSSSKKRIIRVALSQSEEHPEYKGMETFKKYVEVTSMKFSFIQMSFLVDRQKQLS